MFRQIPIGGKKVVAPSARGTQPFPNKLVTAFHVILRTTTSRGHHWAGTASSMAAWQHGSNYLTLAKEPTSVILRNPGEL